MKNYSESNLKFSVDFIKYITEEKSETNCFASPICGQISLTLLLSGANGKTADEIKKALHLFDSAGPATSPHGTVSGAPCGRSGGYYQWLKEQLALIYHHSLSQSLMLGGRIFASSHFNFMEAFRYCIDDLCKVQVELLDFRNQNADARQKMNAWIERQTGGTFTNVFRSVEASTAMILLTALNLRGIWSTPFNPKDTVSGVFWTCKNNSISVDMMTRKGIFDLSDISNPPMTMLKLPYMDGSFCIYFFRPNGSLSPQEILRGSSYEQFKQWLSAENIRSTQTTVHVPKFQMQNEISMNTTLQKMGVRTIFIPGQANLSGIAGDSNIAVSFMDQFVSLSCSEEGVEGAGVSRTELGPGTLSVFKLNRAFFFVVVHQQTGIIVFVGVVCKPYWQH